ncbi:hypothetical protein MED01_002439 [Micromonospora sp. MED01]|uniref:hypothetical protein n=1 Tax=Micromonospora alfalfae TaxID=2911212 RepID=UPI001EE80887|nr:hypothetical protein [Micromonospora alfalfae]MCG5464273.1 hypothetical protein [Micromonospora alfalfae]
MTAPKLSKAAIRALRAAADGTLGRNNSGDVTISLGGATVKDLHVQQLTDLDYITDGPTTRYRRMYNITPAGFAALPADHPADVICPGCNAPLNAPGVTPSRKQAGWCDMCAPDKVTHLVLAGDFATFCGTPMRTVTDTADADATVYDALFGSNTTNCFGCGDVLRDRNKRNR